MRWGHGRTGIEQHHDLPVMASLDHLDWHLRNLWEGGFKVVREQPATDHIEWHRKRGGFGGSRGKLILISAFKGKKMNKEQEGKKCLYVLLVKVEETGKEYRLGAWRMAMHAHKASNGFKGMKGLTVRVAEEWT